MKNTIKPQSRLLCAITLLVIIAFSMVACSDNESINLQGTTWRFAGTEKGVTYTMTLKFEPIYFRIVIGGGKAGTVSGTYTLDGHSGIMKTSAGVSNTFSVSGNKLTLKDQDGTHTFTKEQ
jgi:hypothetical protein